MSSTTFVKLPEKLKARIQDLAQTRQTSPHAIMIQAIERYLDREEKRGSLRQQAKAAHDHYMQTGQHVTNAEARAWFKNLAAGNDLEPPN